MGLIAPKLLWTNHSHKIDGTGIFTYGPVDGSEMLHQLRLVVYPTFFARFYTSQVVQEFFHQQYVELDWSFMVTYYITNVEI